MSLSVNDSSDANPLTRSAVLISIDLRLTNKTSKRHLSCFFCKDLTLSSASASSVSVDSPASLKTPFLAIDRLFRTLKRSEELRWFNPEDARVFLVAVEDFDRFEDLDDLEPLLPRIRVPNKSEVSTVARFSALIVPSSPENLKTFLISSRPRSITNIWDEKELIGSINKGELASISKVTRDPRDAISFIVLPAAASRILRVTL